MKTENARKTACIKITSTVCEYNYYSNCSRVESELKTLKQVFKIIVGS